jgi:hypothetical protein
MPVIFRYCLESWAHKILLFGCPYFLNHSHAS